MSSWTPAGARARRGLRTLTALALPATTLALVGLGAPAAFAANPAESCALSGNDFACSINYAFTGAAQTVDVPAGINKLTVTAVGAGAATYQGNTTTATPGRGAVVTGDVNVTSGSTYFVMVGGPANVNQGGWNGGGSGLGTGGGGGATDLRSLPSSSSATLGSRLVVAGGGGGADINGANGGNAGLVGADGTASPSTSNTAGKGGTLVAGGAPGAGGSGATAGQLGVGGTGASPYGGGGGGGFYGGGGGGGGATAGGTGGGGGSSLVPGGGSVAVNTSNLAPQMKLTYRYPVTGTSLSIGAPSVAAGVADPVTMTVTDGTRTATATPQSLTIAPNGAGTGASCTANACSATQVGTYTVTGTYNGIAKTVTFSVVAGPTSAIVLTPTDETATAGDQVVYKVRGEDAYGNDLGDFTADSLITTTGPGGSNIACPEGVCKVEVAGDYTVDASAPGPDAQPVTDSTSLAVVAGDLASVRLTPKNAVVRAGQSRTYAVSGADRYGNDLGDVTEGASLSYAPVGGGAATACSVSTCTPEEPGTYTVTADVDGLSDTATLVATALATDVTVTPVTGIVYGDSVPVGASVSTDEGAATGTVQFLLDGTPIGEPVTLDPDGLASLPDLTGIHAGLHTLGASYVPADGSFVRGDSETAFLVEKATTTTTVTAAPGKLTATVTGAGQPGGAVDFYVDGVNVGSAALVDGTAVLEGTSNDGGSVVGASYGGDADHAASAASTSRKAPVVTAKAAGPGNNGWFNGPVTVSFTCGSDVTACPSPVVLDKEGAAQYVTRTVVGTDGGVSTVTAGPFNLDLTAPTASVSRVGGGKTYKGRARIGACEGGDALSGLASCTIATTGGPFGAMTTTVTTTDVAGNASTSTASYQVLGTWLARSKQVGSAWTLAKGSRRVLHVMSTSKPKLGDSSAVSTSGFRMVGRTGGITEWVASVTADRSLKAGKTVSLKLKSSQGTQTVRLSITK